MWIATIDLAASLASDLGNGRFDGLAAIAHRGPATSFARGVPLSNLGRRREAREALEKAATDPSFAGAAQVEIGFLDLNAPDGLSSVAKRITDFLKSNTAKSLLVARANHLLGVAQYRLMRAGDALDALTLAQATYQACGCEAGEAQVFDTL